MRNNTVGKRFASIIAGIAAAIFILALPAPVLHTATAPLPAPFTRMLGLVPSVSAINNFSYNDITALWTMYPSVPRPKRFADVSTIRQSQTEYQQTTFVLASLNFGNQAFDSGSLSGTMILDDGIDWYTVDRVLDVQYSQTVPGALIILNGRFDPDSISQALSKRSYTKTDYDGAALWCDPHGCDSGTVKDPAADTTSMTPLFGFQQPIGVTSDYVFSSPDMTTMKEVADKLHTGAFSWQTVPRLYAASEALSARANLIEAVFTPNVVDTTTLISYMKGAKRDAFQKMLSAYMPIPPFTGILFGFASDDKDQLALTALVYENPSNARTAAIAVPMRLESYQPIIGTHTVLQTLTAANGNVIDPGTVYTATATGKSVALIAARSPIPAIDKDPSLKPNVSGAIFRQIVTMAEIRDAYWLIPKYPNQ